MCNTCWCNEVKEYDLKVAVTGVGNGLVIIACANCGSVIKEEVESK